MLSSNHSAGRSSRPVLCAQLDAGLAPGSDESPELTAVTLQHVFTLGYPGNGNCLSLRSLLIPSSIKKEAPEKSG